MNSRESATNGRRGGLCGGGCRNGARFDGGIARRLWSSPQRQPMNGRFRGVSNRSAEVVQLLTLRQVARRPPSAIPALLWLVSAEKRAAGHGPRVRGALHYMFMNTGEILDGKYEITARLGAGGMGEIYKGTHTLLGASRVIKVVHPQIATNTDARDRFLREARVATKIQHPNVATLYDFAALPDGSHYIACEYIDGENLAQRLRNGGTLPPRQAGHIAVQVLHGLEAIHRAGIIHRDISPENIMITPDNTVKIIDLGVAKLDDAD